jgi:hypothetical protein
LRFADLANSPVAELAFIALNSPCVNAAGA